MKSKNRISYPFALTLLVVIGLTLLQALPPITVGEYELRPVALFSDILTEKEEQEPLLAEADTTQLEEPEEPVVIAENTTPSDKIEVTAPEGVVAIEDFSFDAPDPTVGNRHGMARFYEALAKGDELGRPVRIAYYGDSFIEGDLMTSDLRALLQTAYGGSGVGFVDIASPVAGFRASIRATSKNWESFCTTDRDGFYPDLQGIAARYAVPLSNASIQLKGVPHPELHQDTCLESSFFFRVDIPVNISARVNQSEVKQFQFSPSSNVQRAQVSGRIGEIEWMVSDSLSGEFFGVTMDCPTGITVDNISLRGNSGASLRSIPPKTMQDFAKLREYDLIVFQFGLNVANNKIKDYSQYQKQMATVIRSYAEAFPNTSFLIVGVSDRGERKNGEIRTMPCVLTLNQYQRQLAQQTGCSFWSLFEAMGGEGSMGRMVNEEKPALANKDFTHINARGGKFIAQKLFDALEAGKPFYDERRNSR